MAMEEQLAQSTLQIIRYGTEVMIRVSDKIATHMASATGKTVSAMGSKTLDSLRKGRTSLAQINDRGRGGVNVTQEPMSKEDIKNIGRQLHKYHVNYAVEKDPASGKYYLHFQGQDASMVKHALELSLHAVGKEIVETNDAPMESKTVPKPKEKKSVKDVRKELKKRTAEKIGRSKEATPQRTATRSRGR